MPVDERAEEASLSVGHRAAVAFHVDFPRKPKGREKKNSAGLKFEIFRWKLWGTFENVLFFFLFYFRSR